jgi:PKD repeat protein
MSDSSVCPPATITFTDLSTSPNPITNYLWNFGDPTSGVANFSSLQNPSHYYDSTGVYIVTLTITNSQGCSDNVSLPLTVNPPVIADAPAGVETTMEEGVAAPVATLLEAEAAATALGAPTQMSSLTGWLKLRRMVSVLEVPELASC